MKDLDLFYFGDIGFYDEYNPQYIFSQGSASKVLYIIACNEPYSMKGKDIIDKAGLTEKQFKSIKENFLRIKAIDEEDGGYKINFPVFLEKDIIFLDRYMKNVGKVYGWP